MNGPKPDKLDNLIMQAFREEAQKIDVPSSSLLWDNLQRQLENRELRKMEHEAKDADRKDVPFLRADNDSMNKKDGAESASSHKEGKGRIRIWRKYRYITGLTAACLVFAVIFAAMPESSGLKKYFPGFFSANQYMSKMETFESAPEDALKTGKSANDTSTRARTFSAEPEAANEEQITGLYAENSEEPAEEPAGDLPKYHIASGGTAPDQENIATQEKEISDENENGTFVEIAGIEAEEGPEDIYWYEEEGFQNSLDNFREQTNTKILCFTGLPDEYSFKVGTVTKTGVLLQKVYQEFENKDGSILSLSQLFNKQKTEAAEAVKAAKENGSPYPFGSFTGYIVRSPEGPATLTWEDGNSVLILSGQFEEESVLKSCLDLLLAYY